MSIAKVNKVVTDAAHYGGKRLIVLGGGLSGLSFVHYIRNFMSAFGKDRLIDKITILEANDYMGGSVKTNLFEDGPAHELGPRSIRTGGVRAHNTVALLEHLGLEDKLLTLNEVGSYDREKYIYNVGRLWSIPMSMGKIFHKFPNCKKTTLGRAIKKDVVGTTTMDLSPYPDRDPPIYDFISYRFGEEVAENVLDPVIRGLNAGDCRNLSTRALFPDILEKEQTYGSIIKGVFRPPVNKTPHDDLFPNDILKSKLLDKFQRDKTLSFNIRGGLQTIPHYLSNSLLNTNHDNLISIYNQTRVKSIQFADYHKKDQQKTEPCSVIVETIDGDELEIEGDYIISTIPANNFMKLLTTDTIPASIQNKNLFSDIQKIPHSPVGVVCIEYRNLDKSKFIKEMKSLGLLIHSKADSKLLSVSFDSNMFPDTAQETQSTLISCTIGGSWYKDVFGTEDLDEVTDSQLEQIALEEMRKILKIEEEPFRMSSVLWKTGYPQYTPGHKERLSRTRGELRKADIPLILLGQSYDGIAVNDVIFTARLAANDFIKAL